MASIIFLDTHIVVWLYEARLELFSEKAKVAIDANDLMISPMVELELIYLMEIQRIKSDAKEIVSDLQNRIALRVASTPFRKIVWVASGLKWTRDPFDRIITAQAMVENAQLVTADSIVRQHFDGAVW
ncbi:PIN domain-containing protein [bacterium]|nr:PIN domain-containing protein [bacterium]